MIKKILIGIVVAIVAAAVVIVAVHGRQANAPEKSNESPPAQPDIKEKGGEPSGGAVLPPAAVVPPAALPPQPNQPQSVGGGQFSDEGDIMAPDIAVEEVTFDGKSYAPATLTIRNGDVVIFRNKSSSNFWPASSPHPQHTDYPEFDPKKPVAAGQTFEFKFTRSGTWKYHDHLYPSARGTIVVQE